MCNAAAKYQGVALNDIFLSGQDVLQSLIGIVCRFREHPKALSADIEAILLQVAVPNDDNRCLRFLWREDPEQKVTSIQDTLSGQKECQLGPNYALHQVAKDNAVNDESLDRTIQ